MLLFDLSNLGKLLALFAVIIALVGMVLIVLGHLPLFGRLPGDIVIRQGRSTFFFPLVSCLIASVILTILVNLVLWILRR